ncbi:MAG TPA: hypothetical protein VEU08_03135, partial [Vicinamibacterales bacterium]|nr:hypothetical protein [Vicinamibacterales bacterium]
MAKTASKKAPKAARAKTGKPESATRKGDAPAKVKPETARGKLERVKVPSASRREDGSEGKYVYC